MSLFDDDDEKDEFADFDPASFDPAAAHSPQMAGEDLPPPELNPLCLGHDAAESQILSWFINNRMPGTLVLSGPKGVGKSTFAFRLTRFLMNQKTDKSNALFGEIDTPPTDLYTPTTTQAFALIASGGHPDMQYITRPVDEKTGLPKDGITVDIVRPIPDFLRKTASFGGWRVVIIDDADTLNNASQNALLKILEEPPANSLLILVTHNLGALIPTIRSRARVLDMPPLSLDDFTTLIKKTSPHMTATDINLLNSYASGAPGRAIELIEQGGIESLHSVMALFETLPTTNDSELLKAAEVLSVKSNPDPLSGTLDVIDWQLTSRALHFAKSGHPHAMRHWLDTLDSLALHRTMCENGNLDRRHLAFGTLRILQTALKTAI